jgi:hypothetical protein
MHESLRRFWPPEGQILLLKAALTDLETARQAWRQWDARQELADATSPEVGLLAAIARRMPDLAPGVPMDPRLVGARRYIWTLTQTTLGATRPLLAALHAEGLRLMLIKGAARLSTEPMLAQERALRDIDVLVHPQDWVRALRLAKREGWTKPQSAEVDVAKLRYAHAIGLRSPSAGARGECDLHRTALLECLNEGQDLDMWTRARSARFLDVDLLRPSATDFALITLAQSMLYSPAVAPAHWALDVDPLIRAGEIDWDLLRHEACNRRIEAYVAAPLLMLQECLGSPVPAEQLDALVRRLGKHALVEFETRATGYDARLPDQFEARRILAGARAMRVARDHPSPAEARRLTWPQTERRARLKPKEEMAIAAPTGAAPFTRLRLDLSFDVHYARGHAYLTIKGSGLALKMLPIGRASKARGGRVRRRVTIVCPACLFVLRGVDRVRVRTNDRLEIRNVVARWRTPTAERPLERLVEIVRGWRDGLRRSSVA